MESSAAIWEILARDHREVVASGELARLALRLGRDPRLVARHLRRSAYLVPLFKGFYYVRTAEERALHTPRLNPLEIFAVAARAKGLGPWYAGLHSALRENGLTHEFRRDEWIVSTDLYRPNGVRIGGHRFVIHKWRPELVKFGIRKDRPYPYSDAEKTVLDLAYLDLWRVRKGHAPAGEWREYLDRVNPKTIAKYARRYPPGLRRLLEEAP